MRQSEWLYEFHHVYKYGYSRRTISFPRKMSSSPTPNSHFTSPKPSINSDTTYSSETEPEMCDCQNQLGHWDWSGVPRKNLPELCKRSMGINIDNAPTSQIKGEWISNGLHGRNWHTSGKDDSDGDTSVTESDHEWPRGKIVIQGLYKGLKMGSLRASSSKELD